MISEYSNNNSYSESESNIDKMDVDNGNKSHGATDGSPLQHDSTQSLHYSDNNNNNTFDTRQNNEYRSTSRANNNTNKFYDTERSLFSNILLQSQQSSSSSQPQRVTNDLARSSVFNDTYNSQQTKLDNESSNITQTRLRQPNTITDDASSAGSAHSTRVSPPNISPPKMSFEGHVGPATTHQSHSINMSAATIARNNAPCTSTSSVHTGESFSSSLSSGLPSNSQSSSGGIATVSLPIPQAVSAYPPMPISPPLPLHSSMCYELEERVTAIAMTSNGEYVIVGFTSGYVRVYDLSVNTNVDVEDRYGHVLAIMESSMRLHLHIEIGVFNTIVRHRNTTITRQSYHVFIGAKMGTTKMIVVDLTQVQELKRKRGFITMAGNQNIQIFQYSDAKLRGFNGLYSYEGEGDNEGIGVGDNNGSSKGGRAQGVLDTLPSYGYQASYRLLTGKGYGSFTIWKVKLIAASSVQGYGPDKDNVNGDNDDNEGTGRYKYDQEWSVLYHVNINALQISFSSVFLLSIPYENNLAISSQSRKDKVNSKLIMCYAQGVQKDMKLYQFSDIKSKANTCVIQENDGDIDGVGNSVNKFSSVPVRGVNYAHCTSRDGTVVFSGQDSLIVTR